MLSVIVLAAGKGTRMRSTLPKVLHRLAGKPLLGHVLDAAGALKPSAMHCVIGHGAEQVTKGIQRDALNWVMQTEQLGTGHAVQQAMPEVPDEHSVLVLYGDVPLIRTETIATLLDIAERGQVGLLSVEMPDPTGYGRILRNDENAVIGIVEQKDATPEQLNITEINTGILSAPAGLLKQLLSQIDCNNAQGEYYLTDIFALAHQAGVSIETCHPAHIWEVDGVNSRVQLAALERQAQRNQAEALMQAGVTLYDPERLDIRGEVSVGQDTCIDVNVVLEGKVQIGERCIIESGCVIKDSVIGNDVHLKPHCVLESASVGNNASAGPFARLRPGTVMANDSHVGNFVETKNTHLGEGSKANHLTYLGDAEIGRQVNVGAGTITCNYDGANKHKTVIEDGAFIGSDTQLVAPVKVGANVTVGAGTTVTQDVEANALVITRVKQRSIQNWQRPVKKQ